MTQKIYPFEDMKVSRKCRHSKPFSQRLITVLKNKNVSTPLLIALDLLVILGYCYSLYAKQNEEFAKYNPVIKVVDHVSTFFLTLCSLISIHGLLRKAEKHFKFYKELYTDGNLLLGPLFAMKKYHTLRNALFFTFVSIVLIALNAYVYITSKGWNFYKSYVFRDIQFYFFNLTILVLITLARKIETRFAELNKLITMDVENFMRSNVKCAEDFRKTPLNSKGEGSSVFSITNKEPYKVKNFRSMHFDLCNLVEKYNEMLGLILLASITFVIVNILDNLGTIIEYVANERDEDEMTKAYFLGLKCFWIIASVGQGFLMAFYGEFILREGVKTTKICHQLLNNIAVIPKNENEKLLRKELQLLASQSFSRRSVLSACGFFEINFRILGLIITNVTSYLIVITQFLLNTRSIN